MALMRHLRKPLLRLNFAWEGARIVPLGSLLVVVDFNKRAAQNRFVLLANPDQELF